LNNFSFVHYASSGGDLLDTVEAVKVLQSPVGSIQALLSGERRRRRTLIDQLAGFSFLVSALETFDRSHAIPPPSPYLDHNRNRSSCTMLFPILQKIVFLQDHTIQALIFASSLCRHFLICESTGQPTRGHYGGNTEPDYEVLLLVYIRSYFDRKSWSISSRPIRSRKYQQART
jgi:hypothetical protein